MATVNFPARRFICPVIAAYLLHWGVWSLVIVAAQAVMAGLTGTINWFAGHLFGGLSVIEGARVSARFLPLQIADGIIPIILGLLAGWFVWRRKRRSQYLSV
ncbi:MAG TPA: hypothetical protein VKA07_10010 [Candidatus Sulfotelmatobacter sp.]|nr:hypothetical protein [Candidatus Sulfotelmatobacter sp.]